MACGAAFSMEFCAKPRLVIISPFRKKRSAIAKRKKRNKTSLFWIHMSMIDLSSLLS